MVGSEPSCLIGGNQVGEFQTESRRAKAIAIVDVSKPCSVAISGDVTGLASFFLLFQPGDSPNLGTEAKGSEPSGDIHRWGVAQE